jgi:hypothetical protein
MKLIIKRGQVEQKSLLGSSKGVTFSLHCKVILNEEEQKLVQKYRASLYTLTNVTYENGQPVHVSGLLGGITYKQDHIGDLLKNEAAIKEACEELKMLLQVMASFGGEEVIEF